MAKPKFSLRKNPWASAAQWAKAEAAIAREFPKEYARAVVRDPEHFKMPFAVSANGDRVTVTRLPARGLVTTGTAEAWAGLTVEQVMDDLGTSRLAGGERGVRATMRVMRRAQRIKSRLQPHRLAGKRSAPPMIAVHEDGVCCSFLDGQSDPWCKGARRERQGMPVLIAQARARARG